MILYGSSLSPYVRKVMAYAAEKGIALENDAASAGPGSQSEAFRRASPFGKMPALADGDFTLADSSAIIHYLEARFPDPVLIPADPEARGKVIWFEEFADTVLTQCGAKLFFNRLVAPIFLNREGDEEAASKAEREELPPILDYLERTVPEAGAFLVGDSLTLADIAVAGPFANFRHIACTIDRDRYARTLGYVEAILERPSFAPTIARETAFLDKVRG